MSISGCPARQVNINEVAFSSRPITLTDSALGNDGFWPALTLTEFQRLYRMPVGIAEDRLTDALALAMRTVNQDLAATRMHWQRDGVERLETADIRLLPDRAAFVAAYKRAAYTCAKAHLLARPATGSHRVETANQAKRIETAHELFQAFSRQAVRLLQGRGHIMAQLS